MAWKNNFEGLTKAGGGALVDEDALSLATGGGASAEGGGANDLPTTVTTGANTSLVVDSGVKAHGTFSARVSKATANANGVFFEKAGIGPGGAIGVGAFDEHWHRIYFEISALPSTLFSFIRFRSSTNGGLGNLRLTTGGVLRFQDVAAANFDLAGLVIAANTQYRIEWRSKRGNTSADSEFEIKVWVGANMDSSGAPDYTHAWTHADGLDTGQSYLDKMAFGDPVGVNIGIRDMWFDDIRIAEAAWVGSVISSITQKARPFQDSGVGNWTNQAGAVPISPAIGEATEDDATYAQSGLSPVAADISHVKLDAMNDPLSSTNHKITVVYGKDTPGSGDVLNLTVRLMQYAPGVGGRFEILNKVYAGVDAKVTDVINLTGGQADAILDYGDLWLDFEAIKP